MMMIELCSGFSDCNVGVDLGGDTKETRSSKRLKRPKSQSQQSEYEDVGVDLGADAEESKSAKASKRLKRPKSQSQQSGYEDDGVDLGGEDYSSLSRSGSSSSSNRAQPTARSGPPDRYSAARSCPPDKHSGRATRSSGLNIHETAGSSNVADNLVNPAPDIVSILKVFSESMIQLTKKSLADSGKHIETLSANFIKRLDGLEVSFFLL